MAQAPDPAVRDMVAYMDEIGCENCFDRFDKQKPHCAFGLAGICCKVCSLGPCKIIEKSQRGTCGANADLIVARDLARAAAGGVTAHGARAREVMLTLEKAAAGEVDLPLVGKDKVLGVAKMYGLEIEGKTIEALAGEIADILLEDMGRTAPGTHHTLAAAAPHPERQKVWGDLGILPIGSYHEVFETLHASTVGTQGDWRKVMDQFFRLGLTFFMNSVVDGSIASDCLFGVSTRSTVRANVGRSRKTSSISRSMEETRGAARAACCDEFLSRLPQGYDTPLSEGGASLSGGERKRVAVARAILKNASIVVLDEATASLDPENEAQMQAAFPTLLAEKTVLLIAHLLSTVRGADQILFMQDGRIAERGGFEELLALGGRFRRFWDLQRSARGWRITPA